MLARLAPAATVVSLTFTACTDAVLDAIPTVLSENELIFLAVQPSAPAPITSSSTVNTGQPVTHRTLHADQFNTQFLEISFPANAVVAVGPRAVDSGEPVEVTVRPQADRYIATLEPEELEFNDRTPPTIRFTYGRYGDRSVADGTRYASRDAYSAALRIWMEISAGRWERIDASTASPDAVSGPLSTGGRFAVAAPR